MIADAAVSAAKMRRQAVAGKLPRAVLERAPVVIVPPAKRASAGRTGASASKGASIAYLLMHCIWQSLLYVHHLAANCTVQILYIFAVFSFAV